MPHFFRRLFHGYRPESFTRTASSPGTHLASNRHAASLVRWGHGVRVALDDFGIGHSSLGLLQTCPVDILKVDKSFIDDITAPGRPAVIARALINVSDGLNLTAVAEGVETATQADRLLTLGYHYAQGYHFGRPVPAADITASVTSRAVLVA